MFRTYSDPYERPRPLNYYERTQVRINAEENILQQELVRFEDFILQNKLLRGTLETLY